MDKVINFRYQKDTLEKINPILIKGGTHLIFSLPFEIEGRGINSFPDEDNDGWFKYMVTLRAFDKLIKEHSIIAQAHENNEIKELIERLIERRNQY